MPRNSSISSFKRLPLAAILAVLVVCAVESFTTALVEEGRIVRPQFMTIYQKKVEQTKACFRDEPVVVVGNSRSMGIRPYLLSQSLFGAPVNGVYFLSEGGVMPATHLHMLEALEGHCIKKNTLTLFCLTPMCLNHNNSCFSRTILNLFSFPQFFSDLVLNLRGHDMEFFMGECSLNLLQHRARIQSAIKRKLFSMDGQAVISAKYNEIRKKPKTDQRVVKQENVEQMVDTFVLEYYPDYEIDPYQINAIQKITDKVREKGGRVVFVMLPLSAALRELLDREHLQDFSKAVDHLAKKNHVLLLDYLTGFSGKEYEYYDASHFTLDSRRRFTETLANDLKKNGFPPEGFPVPRNNGFLMAQPATLSSSRGGTIRFELNAGDYFRNRKYLLLGSCSGIDQGVSFGGLPWVLPLNKDFLYDFITRQANGAELQNFKGVLNSGGRAHAKMTLSPQLTGQFKGYDLWFAFMLLDPIDFTSNPVRVECVD